MSIPARLRSYLGRGRWTALLVLGSLAACQPKGPPAEAAAPPPVGHYQGSLGAAGQAQLRAALDIRHPSQGHYDAELTVPGAPTLSFVADTVVLAGHQLRLVRPARPGQVLTLTLDGDFWRGSLAVDSVSLPLILLRRGVSDPSNYRVAAKPQADGPGWLFAPTDIGTAGAALALMPDAATAPAAALWADALARAGIIVLLLPPAPDSATVATERPRLQTAFELLRGTAGTDTANVGVWAAGTRAAALAPILAANRALRPSFFIAQNTVLDAAGRAAFGELRRQKLPVLALYGGDAGRASVAMRQALGGRRTSVRTYRATGPDLLMPVGFSPQFGAGLPDDVAQWLPRK
jgi:hypothetical protein